MTTWAYKVEGYEGVVGYFSDKKDANACKKRSKQELHNKYCTEGYERDVECLCSTSNGEKMCAAHTYLYGKTAHTVIDCTIAADTYVEEIKIQ